MIVYDMATKVPGTEVFPQHHIAGLISGTTFIVLFSQETFLYGERKLINTHTHAHAHTHTHTHTLTHSHTHTLTHSHTRTISLNFDNAMY